jgi:hypothetical protein
VFWEKLTNTANSRKLLYRPYDALLKARFDCDYLPVLRSAGFWSFCSPHGNDKLI